MSEQSRRTTNTVGSYYGQKPGKYVAKNNVKGQTQDKLTSKQLNVDLQPHLTTYNDDYNGSKSNAGNKNAKSSSSKLSLISPKYGPQIAQHAPQANSVRSQQVQGLGNASSNESVSKARINPPVEASVQKEVQSYRTAQDNANFNKASTNRLSYDPETVHEDVKKSFYANPNIKVDNEAEYYETVRRLDDCGRCWTGQQKYVTAPFKLKEKMPGATLYQKDYVKHPLDGKKPEIRNDFYSGFKIEEPGDFATNMKNDFKPWPIEPTDLPNQNKPPKAGVPFAGRAGYKADYINWGNMPVNYEKAPNNISVIPELPFIAKTSYGENFGNKFPYERARPVDRDLWKNQGKSPLSPGIPFLAQTTHQKAFKPFKVFGAPMFPSGEEFEPTEAYPNQYKSTYDQDFVSPGNWKCPARVFLDTHPHPRAKYMDV